MEWNTQDILQLAARLLHILAGMTAVGGTVFARFAVVPALAALPEDERKDLHAALRSRWSKIVAVAIAGLLISGLYSYARMEMGYRLPSWYRAVFGVKFLLAMVLFMLASMLSGRSAASARLRENASGWLGVNLLLAVAIVALSGVLRAAHTQGLPVKPAGAAVISARAAQPAAADATGVIPSQGLCKSLRG